jgi:hypothetical protein
LEVRHIQRVIVDRVDDSTRLSQAHTFTDSIGTTYPARVYKPDLSLVFLALFGEHLGVGERVQRQECFTIAGREGGLWLLNGT